jgi:hypothetical protein
MHSCRPGVALAHWIAVFAGMAAVRGSGFLSTTNNQCRQNLAGAISIPEAKVFFLDKFVRNQVERAGSILFVSRNKEEMRHCFVQSRTFKGSDTLSVRFETNSFENGSCRGFSRR